MKNLWHKNLTSDKWNAYPMERQILMIGSEFARAKSLLTKGAFSEVSKCYERAFELLDLCSGDSKWKGRRKELRRFRELLGELYLDEGRDNGRCIQFYRVLMGWNRNTAKVEL